MQIKTLADIPEIKGKKIIVRMDADAPIDNDEITDDTRIIESIPTINYLRLKGAKVIITGKRGRPKGKVVEELRLTKIAEHLSKLIEVPVKKFDEIVGEKIEKEIDKMKDGDLVMLENTRFDPGDEGCNPEFTEKFAKLGEIFVSDNFSCAHRTSSTTTEVAKYLPSYAGLLMEKEVKALSKVLDEEPIRPLTMIFGGAKIDTKIGLIKHFIDKADYFLIGGGIANTFLYAAGYYVGESLHEKDKAETAREIMLLCEKNKDKLVLPHDVVVTSELKKDPEVAHVGVEDIIGDMKIFDLGKWSADKFCNIIEKSGTVIWNGPVGLFEHPPFQEGSRMIADCLARHECLSIIGGGDTVDCIKRLNIPIEAFTHVSTGGGACIEFLEGKILPGIEILKK